LKRIYHYFINSHSIKEDVNAGTFAQYALQAAEEIFKNSNQAVMVGGTGLYIKAFCEGMDEMPNVPDAIRNNIVNQYKLNGLGWLQNEVEKKDAAFWKVAEQQNPQRLMRALEIVEVTGKSILFFRQDKKAIRNFNIIKIGLELPKEELYKNINTRVDVMMDNGLLEEVQLLVQYRSLNALQTVGYKELLEYIDGHCSLDIAIENIKRNTRHYAKRQITWFKKDTGVHWFNALGASVEDVLRITA
jgi:tRNA dimethylallyltransferase